MLHDSQNCAAACSTLNSEFALKYGFKNKPPSEPFGLRGREMSLCELCGISYFFVTGTTTQPEVDSVKSRAEKHQMTTFLPLIQATSLAALR